MKLYIAASIGARLRLRPIRDALWKAGIEVVSTWLDEVATPSGMSEDIFLRKCAMRDLAEIKSADVLVLDTNTDGCRHHGKQVEFGIALGQYQAKQVYIVGPYMNVFNRLADHQFTTWEEALPFLTSLKTNASH